MLRQYLAIRFRWISCTCNNLSCNTARTYYNMQYYCFGMDLHHTYTRRTNGITESNRFCVLHMPLLASTYSATKQRFYSYKESVDQWRINYVSGIVIYVMPKPTGTCDAPLISIPLVGNQRRCAL